MNATAENLNSAMSFDHVIRVNADKTVTDVDESYYFDVTSYRLEDETWKLETQLPDGWTLMTGYTGQHGYNGPEMHQSEFIGGRMARDILETPGLYVALEVRPDCGHTEEGCTEEDGCICEPDGWVVAHKPAE